MTFTGTAYRELSRLLGEQAVIDGAEAAARPYLTDASASRGISGRADAVALPANASEVAAVLRWCYEHDVPLIPRGGGTGYSGGAVPVDGGVVIGLERLATQAEIDPGQWRARLDAGIRTDDLRRRAREHGLMFPPDPGAGEQSTVGGNIATNAGGPHAFKYGPTGAWVTGLDVVLAPGEQVTLGGPVRKDVAGYDLKSLLVGSEGTLGIVTAAWLKLIPAPELSLPVVGLYPGAASGCAAITGMLEAGLLPAAIEFLDAGAVRASIQALTNSLEAIPPTAPETTGFIVIADADGSAEEAALLRRELRNVMRSGAVSVYAPTSKRDTAELWRWRDGVSLAVTAQRGGKLSEDIAVPVERLEEAIAATVEIGERHGLEACSWGHAGDGNLHSTFLISPDDPDEQHRAEAAAEELFGLATQFGGSVSGEHGVGLVKRAAVQRHFSPERLALQDRLKQALDPKGLLNPGKKLPG